MHVGVGVIEIGQYLPFTGIAGRQRVVVQEAHPYRAGGGYKSELGGTYENRIAWCFDTYNRFVITTRFAIVHTWIKIIRRTIYTSTGWDRYARWSWHIAAGYIRIS